LKPLFQYFSDEEVQLLHDSALDILQNTGMQMPCQEAIEILSDAGAKVEDNNIVKIPADLVDRALETVPKRSEVTLYARDPKHDITFTGDQVPVLATMTEATHVLDPYDGKKRPATNEDLVKITKIIDNLEHVGVAGGLVTPQDVPGEVAEWYSWATNIKNTTKHITNGGYGTQGVRDIIKMASIAVGSEEAFHERPYISFWILTKPALQIDRLTLEALIEMSKHKVPAIISSGPILGVSSPITIAGTCAQAHAETLACITLGQLVNPGAPVIYTSFARGFDFKTGSVTMSSPEFAILKVCMAQLGRFLDLPTRMPSMLRDAKILDGQAGFETGMVGLSGALAADLLDSMQFDMDVIVDFADLIYCNECMSQLRRMAKEIIVDEKTLGLDVISKLGPGGNFLGQKHTVKYCRKEIWQADLTERRNWTGWENDGALDIREKALKRALAMLDELSDVELLDKETQRAIDEIAAKATLDYEESI
jgi:trimethylamine--corrinoid protein Co-methyltransferase